MVSKLEIVSPKKRISSKNFIEGNVRGFFLLKKKKKGD